MSLSSGELLKKALDYNGEALSQWVWMFATKKIPIKSVDHIIFYLEKSLETMKELRTRAK